MTSHRVRAGFTLVEVIVALALAGLVVLIAHRLFGAVADGVSRLSDARATVDRVANARRWLADAFGSLDVGTPQSGGFLGRLNHVEFGTWLLGSEGWFERRRVTLYADRGALLARLGGADTLALGDSVAALEFDYLLEPGANAVWVREWISPVSAPLAVRVRIAHGERTDTLLFIVGPRG